jgi:predicted SnoaL-like aldol condensation-catalyzing enzyme
MGRALLVGAVLTCAPTLGCSDRDAPRTEVPPSTSRPTPTVVTSLDVDPPRTTVPAPDAASLARQAVLADHPSTTVHRVIVDGDPPDDTVARGTLVVVQHESVDGAQRWARADVMLVDATGEIIERWSVAQPAAATTPSGHTMFDGGGDVRAPADLGANEALVRRLYEQAFVPGDPEVLAELVAPDYVQHNPALPDGRDALAALVGGGLPVEVVHLASQGDLVAALVQYGETAAVDIFRIEGDHIIEHWDVLDRPE